MAAHGNAATTREALEVLLPSLAPDTELLLVDDQSPDDTLAVFREMRSRHSNTKVFAFDANLEYCESVNAILSHAKGDQVLFVSNDIFAPPAYLRELLRTASAQPDCGILRGCSNFVDGASEAHNVAMTGFGSRDDLSAFAEEIADLNRTSPLLDERFLIGDAFLVTRRVIDRIGTFDTRFRGYYGDADYSLRAQRAGFRVVLERRAFAWHEKDSNLAYLPVPEQNAKRQRRHERVSVALSEFVHKYAIPVTQASVFDLPWEELARRTGDDPPVYVPPKDYSRYLLK